MVNMLGGVADVERAMLGFGFSAIINQVTSCAVLDIFIYVYKYIYKAMICEWIQNTTGFGRM